ncbi:uncharacterized protein LOC116716100 isoform X9 [Xiphophorus hellerii]|uniref:uncharacterized protein LOC116716100 isoform X9 n=1 Tax=Xiphophorus hellerii TaxID=8084 RepID=UPI0013B3BB6A|nr:uncharacterized protein LOC116716100 isoform X9 [Xiphophorus hellerii]
MACSKQSAKDYIANARVYLVGELRNLSVILENLYQQKVLTDEEVSKIKAEKDDYDRTRAILDSVTRKGEAACYRFLRIIDQTRRRTLERPTPIFKISHEASTEATKFDLHHWISCFSFTEDPETDQNYIQESRPCYRYQAKLKSKAEKISKDFWKRSENLFAEKKKPELLYTSLILDIQGKNFPTRINRFKRDMCRPKKLRTEISPSDLLKADKNILLVGKPGIGKTALSHEILRLWSERDSKELDYMFYFDMRELTNIPPITSLEDLLFTACSEPDKGKDEVLHDIKSNSDNVTVILDGVTDLSSSIVKNLVDKDFLPDAKIIITCRPNDGKDLCLEDWLRVEVKGFSEETIKTYLSSTLGEAHRKVFRNVELLTLCHVPMYALMVAASFSSKDSLQPRTVTEIYINIVRFGLQMNSNKTRIRNLNQFIKTKRNGILSLAEAAFNATERKTVNLGELSCEDSCVLSFLKTLDVKVPPTETKTLYAFLHYTIQDFFAALWLLKNPDKIREVFQQCLTEEKKHMKHLIPFMCRLLNDKSPRLMSCLIPAEEIKETSGWFFTEIIDTFFHQAVANISELHVDTLFVYQCLFESQSSEVCISFLAKLDFHLDLSGANLDPYSCCAVAYVVTQSKERKISLNLQDVTITAQGMRHLFGCLQNVEWYDTLKQQLWKIFLLSEEEMDYQTLLGLSGNLLHLPVVGKKKLFDRAVKVLQTIATKVNVCLYGDRKDPLCPILRNSLLETLPCINSLRMTYRSAGSMNQEECNNTMEKDQKNMFLDLCFTTALYSKQKFYTAMPELVRVCQVKTDLVNTLVDLHQHAISRGLSTDFPTLRPVFQSTPADWLIDLSERKASTLLEMLKLQSEKKKVELTGFSHDKSEMRNLLQCLPYLSKLSFVTEPTESSESIWFLEMLICAAAEMKEQNGVNMLELLSVCTYRGTPLQWKWCDFLLDLYSSKTETGPTFSSFTSVLQSADPAIWFVKLSKTKASMLLDVLKLQSGKKQVNLTGCSHEEAEVRSFLHCLPYISRLSVVPLWSSSVEQTRFLTRLFCAAAEREKQTGEKMLEMLASVCRYKHFPFNNRSIDETYRRNFLLDLYSQMNDCETETGLSLLPSIQSVFQSAPEIWTLDLSKIKTSILLEVMKLQPEKKQVKVTNWSYEEHEVRNLIKCLPYISKFRFVPESSKLHEQTSFLVTLYCAAAEREQQTGEKMLDRLASVCTFKIIPVSDTDMNEQAQKAFLLSLYGQVTDCESKTGLSLFPLLKSVFQSVANVWITDLSERNTLMLRELLIQSEKKQVVLKGCSHEESEVKSFLECLPFFSQLSFEPWVSEASEEIQFLRSLFCAAEKDEQKEMKTLDMLASVYVYREAPLKQKWSEFLLELFSYELKTGLSVLPLQRANVILFKVLKLKSSRTHGPRIAPGSSDLQEQRRFLVNLFCAAAEREQQTGEKMVEMLAPLCRYKTFPFKAGDKYRVDFLLDLYSQVKDRETKSGLSLLPSLQSVFQSAPKLWTIKFSKRKTSDFMEVMKLQAEKKRVELTDCSYEESEVRSFLQCLPFISQLRCMPRFFQSVCSSLSVRSREEIQQLVSLLQLLNFNLFLTGELNDKTCSSVGKVLPLVGSKVDLILTDSRMSVRGAAVLFRSTTQLHSLRLSNSLVLFFSQWVRRGRVAFPLVLEELSVVSTKAQPQRVLLKVGSSLASLLRFWTVGRLDLTESGLPVQSLFSLLLHDGPLTLRLSEERLQQLLVLLHEVQDQDRTLSLLNKVGGDLSSCQLSWELLHFLLQQPTGQTITVNLKKNRFLEERAAELLPFLHRMVIQRLSPSFVRTSIREIFRTHPSHMISWLLRSLDLVINLNCTELDSKDCDALLFILRHSDGVKLKLLWSSIPAEGIQSILSMLHTVSDLSVDRNLLLRFIHCCAASDSQQGAASGLLRTLRHRLDLSCSSCVELPEEDQTEPLRLTAADCGAVSTVLRHSSRDTQLDLRDCEVEDSGLDLLFPVLDGVRLRVNKTVPVQLLSLLAANNQRDTVRRATSLCRALGGELDLSHRSLDQRLCGALSLMLDYSEDLTELDLSHCQLTDQLLLQLITHLHKVHNLDLSHNQITDASTGWLLHLVAINPFIVSVSLNNNNIINKTPFKDNRKFEIS